MKKILQSGFVAAVFAMGANSALADDAVKFDIELMMRVEMDLHQLCRIPGSPAVVSDEACVLRDIIRIELTKLGYKFDLAEREWVK